MSELKYLFTLRLINQNNMFSKACEYGIRATIYIASQSLENKRSSLKDIAAEIASPVAFTAKILQQLSRSEIVSSTLGASGGFEISKAGMKKLRLSQIVFAIDGDTIYKGCGLGLEACNAKKPCPMHDKFKRIRDELKSMLESTSVFELTQGLSEGFTFLKR